MDNVYVILSRPHDNEQAAASISALSRALYEKNAYALVRYVGKEDQHPKLGILMPYFEPHVDALHFVRVSGRGSIIALWSLFSPTEIHCRSRLRKTFANFHLLH
jgi:hypothetical protein